MGSIREYTKRDGAVTYHAEVRIKGHPPRRASFEAREEARQWIECIEGALRPGSDTEHPEDLQQRHDWTVEELEELYNLPLPELVYRAASVNRRYHPVSEVQLGHLISVKHGGCSEDCKYCPQSAHYNTGEVPQPIMSLEEVMKRARWAKEEGASRICMGAAWRQVREGKSFDRMLELVRGVASLGLEVCCTLGMLTSDQIRRLKAAGLYAYNHNLDSSREHYKTIITTRTYDERLETLKNISEAGVSVCCGGILGLGEKLEDRLELIRQLSSLQPHPESVPINRLNPVKGTPLEDAKPVPVLELVRAIAVARIAMPQSSIRLSAGRSRMSDAEQALCFVTGVNSFFLGPKLFATNNPQTHRDQELLEALGMHTRAPFDGKRETVAPPPLARTRAFMQRRLDKKKIQGTLRALAYNDPDLIDLTSNDYLGIASDVEMAQEVEAVYQALAFKAGIRPKIGATGSRLLTGNQPYVEVLEETIARYHGAEAALLFNAGYLANTGLISCIATEEDAIIMDTRVHASSWDGARVSRAKSYVFRHNDLDSLQQQLAKARKIHQEVFVCIESLYSMDGDIAPLEKIHALCEQYEAWMIVDEAHATGILGTGGRGLVYDMAIKDRVLARIHTFGKAMGCHGAAVLGTQLLRDYLINHCRAFIYTTAFPLHTLVSIQTVYGRLPALEERRKTVSALIRYFRTQISRADLPIRTTDTPIQNIPITGNAAVQKLSEQLRANGLDVRAIRAPTVRPGNECLRICLHSFNTQEHIDRLVSALALKEREVFIA